MNIRPYKLHQPKGGSDGPWRQMYHGLYCNLSYGQDNGNVPPSNHEWYLEACCVLSALTDTDNPRFMELGAGWGRQTLLVAANKGIKGSFYAVEAEPNHFQWLQNTLLYNKVQATTIFGAMTDKRGWTGMETAYEPSNKWYGQYVGKGGNIKVPAYSLDYLFDVFGIGELDLLHMDVQAQELNVLRGAVKCLPSIKNLIIGIHSKVNPQDLIDLSPAHKVMLCIPKKNGPTVVPGFEEPINIKADGLLVLERK